jgi:CBS domain-containing protein
MGEELEKPGLETEERNEFMKALLRDVRALERMLEEDTFETGVRRIGAEQEMFLVDSSYRPGCVNLDVLDQITGDGDFVTELGKFNMEFNAQPSVFEGDCLRELEEQLTYCLETARAAAQTQDADVALVGILPTLRKSDLDLDNMTPRERYYALNEALTELRGADYEFNIQGIDEFIVKHDSVMLEAANTSFQVHFQVEPDEFADLYNIAQVAAAPVLAAGPFSPMLLGKRLWHETRIALFQQSVDTRSSDLHHRELEPRVTFGNQWIDDSVLEIYREDIARFRLLFGLDVEEDPMEVLDEGGIPDLDALCLHNGTVYRWNRACYGVSNGKPHLRIENRVLPSGPTPQDEVANAAFWFGLMSGLVVEHGDITDSMEFADAKTNFFSAARQGIGAQMMWTDGRTWPAADLIEQKLLPLAAEGLESSGIADSDITRYLDIIGERVRSKKTGSQWMLDSFHDMDEENGLAERMAAITASIVQQQGSGNPVHEWEPATLDEGETTWADHYLRVGQYMRTDFFTVGEDEIIDLVANVMDWQRIRHVPIEDNENRLVGLVTHRNLLRLLAENLSKEERTSLPVRDVMVTDVVTVTPDTNTVDAINLMRDEEVSCLPVVAGQDDDRLVGFLSERDFLGITREMVKERFAELDDASLRRLTSSESPPPHGDDSQDSADNEQTSETEESSEGAAAE